jgi:hypothetical protein
MIYIVTENELIEGTKEVIEGAYEGVVGVGKCCLAATCVLGWYCWSYINSS